MAFLYIVIVKHVLSNFMGRQNNSQFTIVVPQCRSKLMQLTPGRVFCFTSELHIATTWCPRFYSKRITYKPFLKRVVRGQHTGSSPFGDIYQCLLLYHHPKCASHLLACNISKCFKSIRLFLAFKIFKFINTIISY